MSAATLRRRDTGACLPKPAAGAARGGRSRAGLTLVEVMLAVAILGVAMVVLLTGASRCLSVLRRAKDYQEALWTLGRGEVDHPLMMTNDVQDLAVDGETYDNGLVFSRSVDEKDESEKDGLYVVRTRVSWQWRDREVCEEVVRYVYQPEEDK